MASLRRACAILGVWLAAVGLKQIASGTKGMPDGGPSGPVVDSQARAAGAIVVWLGVVQIWAAQRPSPAVLRLLSGVMASIAVARLAGVPEHGKPKGVLRVALATEVASAVLLLAASETSLAAS
ncbi:MAG: DUF4345 domain-containing protein [Segniliparus sp.]|uniref:DUF4345 domain-containing protein n=1 Tax=Segniliparus sp. TaxID=2804064 RepID=UPI003F3E6BA4